MEEEAERHSKVGGDKPAEPGSRVEDVTVADDRTERHTTEDEGVPLWDRSGGLVHLGAEEAEGVAGPQLIIAREKLA